MLRTIGRLIWVFISFVLASLIATFVLVTLGLERFVQDVQDVRVEQVGEGELGWVFDYGQQAIFIGGLASALTIVPGLLVIVIGEVASIRSAIYYVLAGGAALVAVPLMASVMAGGEFALPSTTLFQVFATAGFAGGLAYWVLAGRST